MPLYDLDRTALETYLPDLHEPADFDAFWADTLKEARTHDLALTLTPVDSGLSLVEVFDVEFAGFGGHPIKAWLTRPTAGGAPAGLLPAVVQYNGYGGGRGLPHEHVAWAAAGYVHLFMDTRGQGSRWGAGGDTPDPVGTGPAAPGFMTRGLLDPADHYFRRVFTDAVRAVEAVRAVAGSSDLSPAGARGAASPSRWPDWSRTCLACCPTYRSCATSVVRSTCRTGSHTPRSRPTCPCTATTSRPPSARCPTSTG